MFCWSSILEFLLAVAAGHERGCNRIQVVAGASLTPLRTTVMSFTGCTQLGLEKWLGLGAARLVRPQRAEPSLFCELRNSLSRTELVRAGQPE